MGRTMDTLSKYRDRLYNRLIVDETLVYVDAGKHEGKTGTVVKIGNQTDNSYFTILIQLNSGINISVGGDNFDIIKE